MRSPAPPWRGYPDRSREPQWWMFPTGRPRQACTTAILLESQRCRPPGEGTSQLLGTGVSWVSMGTPRRVLAVPVGCLSAAPPDPRLWISNAAAISACACQDGRTTVGSGRACGRVFSVLAPPHTNIIPHRLGRGNTEDSPCFPQGVTTVEADGWGCWGEHLAGRPLISVRPRRALPAEGRSYKGCQGAG